MDDRESLKLNILFKNSPGLSSDDKQLIRRLIEGHHRPNLQLIENASLADETRQSWIMDLWMSGAKRLSEENLISDPRHNPTKLSDGHKVYRIDEARSIFGGQKRPPFCIRGRLPNRKEVEIASILGRRPKIPTVTDLRKEPWDGQYYFWTLDVEDRRYIVAHFQNGLGYDGLGYRTWRGGIDHNDFANSPVAFSTIDRKIRSVEKTDEEDIDDRDDTDLEVGINRTRSGHTFRTEDSTVEAAQSLGDQQSKLNVIAEPALPVEISNSRDALSDQMDQNVPEVRHTMWRSVPPRYITIALPVVVDSLQPRMRPPSSKPITLAPLRGKNTWFRLAIQNGSQFARGSWQCLGSCSTITEFFQLLSKGCEIDGQGIHHNSFDTVVVDVPWLPNNHPHRELRIDRDIDTMGTLLREVDNAPCWCNWKDEKPRAILFVLVVLKPGWYPFGLAKFP